MLLLAARHGWGRGGAAAWVGMGPTAELGVWEAAEGGESGGVGGCAGERRDAAAAGDGEGREATMAGDKGRAPPVVVQERTGRRRRARARRRAMQRGHRPAGGRRRRAM